MEAVMPDRFKRADGSEVPDERKHDPNQPGTAVMAALPGAAAAGSAAGVAAAAATGFLKYEPWWLKVASQATWGTIGALFLFLFWNAIQDSQRQDRQERTEERAYQRTEGAARSDAVVGAIRELKAEVGARKAIDEERAADVRSAVSEMRAVNKSIDALITEMRKDRSRPPVP